LVGGRGEKDCEKKRVKVNGSIFEGRGAQIKRSEDIKGRGHDVTGLMGGKNRREKVRKKAGLKLIERIG